MKRMKRILFYAAAVGIFVSSALAKPARGAVPTVCMGGSVVCADAESFLSELLRDRLCGGGMLFFSGGCTGGGGALQGGGSLEGQQDVEWFPGQGGTQKPGTECVPGQDGTQKPGTECVPGQGDAQEPGIEWFPGQGGTQATGIEWFPNHGGAQEPGIEWFPGQGEPLPGEPEDQQPDTQLPPVQIPGIEWFPGGQGGSQSGGSGSQSGSQGSGQGSQNENPGQGSSSGSYITRIVELVNVQRTAAGLSPVKESAVLSSAADIRAQEIVSNFSHYRPDGTYFNSVLNQRGISYNGAGENIAYGYDTPERVMTEWMNSPSHRANILDSRFTKLGVGYYVVGGTKYWTQLFTY